MSDVDYLAPVIKPRTSGYYRRDIFETAMTVRAASGSQISELVKASERCVAALATYEATESVRVTRRDPPEMVSGYGRVWVVIHFFTMPKDKTP